MTDVKPTKAEAAEAYRRMKAEVAAERARVKAEALAAKQTAQAHRLKLKADAAATKARIVAEKQAAREAAKAARATRFHSGADWRHGDISWREYASYEDYVAHQVDKLEAVRPGLERRFDETTEGFRRRFELLDLDAPSNVLCLGARLGQEVAAFIALGHFAVGLDLNPGEQNRFVVSGDFHRLQFADGSVDVVYVNSLDHIFDLKAFTAEIRRVLKPGGLFVGEIVSGYEEGFTAGEFEAMHWPTAQGFAERLAEAGDLALEGSQRLDAVGAPAWLQCRFRKPADPATA